MRVLVALGGNAMTSPDGRARPEDQQAAIARACDRIAGLVAAGHEVVLTHGNGPQVGNLLVKNEMAAGVVPPVPLDWCDAQTQGTIGFTILNALEAALAARGVDRPVAAVVTRTRVDPDDPGFTTPTKPVGRYLPEGEARVLMGHGQHWEDRGDQGWRRVVASPEPLEVLDTHTVATLVAAGYVVVAAGGGGIPVVPEPGRAVDTAWHGVEAVIDKDLTSAILAHSVGADVLVIATDVENAIVGYDTPEAAPLGTVTLAELRRLAVQGHFGGGSMGPKVEAVCRFVEASGGRAVITSLAAIERALAGETGTIVVPTASYDTDVGG